MASVSGLAFDSSEFLLQVNKPDLFFFSPIFPLHKIPIGCQIFYYFSWRNLLLYRDIKLALVSSSASYIVTGPCELMRFYYTADAFNVIKWSSHSSYKINILYEDWRNCPHKKSISMDWNIHQWKLSEKQEEP